MPDKIVKIDGNLTLDQTKNRCVVEQNEGFQLAKIANGTVTQNGEVLMINNAEFDFNLEFLPELDFVELGANNPQTIKAQKAAEGWTFITSGSMFVQNDIRVVLVFGR